MPLRPEQRQRYPADWPEIRRMILLRAARDQAGVPRCECRGECDHHLARCTAYQGQRLERAYRSGTFEVVLTVAHLDHQPENNHPANLRALCQPCHLRYDAVQHAHTARVRRARESGLVTLPGLDPEGDRG